MRKLLAFIFTVLASLPAMSVEPAVESETIGDSIEEASPDLGSDISDELMSELDASKSAKKTDLKTETADNSKNTEPTAEKKETDIDELEKAVSQNEIDTAKSLVADLKSGLREEDVINNPPGYRIREFDGQLELKTPWGDFVIPGDYGPNGMAHYKFAIPIDLLKPPELEKQTDDIMGPQRDLASVELVSEPAPVEPVLPESPKTPDSKPVEENLVQPVTPKPPVRVVIDDTDILIVEANHLYNKKKYYESLIIVERLLRKDPENLRGWLMRGSLLLVQGHRDLALKAWEQANKISPEDPEVLAVLNKYK